MAQTLTRRIRKEVERQRISSLFSALVIYFFDVDTRYDIGILLWYDMYFYLITPHNLIFYFSVPGTSYAPSISWKVTHCYLPGSGRVAATLPS